MVTSAYHTVRTTQVGPTFAEKPPILPDLLPPYRGIVTPAIDEFEINLIVQLLENGYAKVQAEHEAGTSGGKGQESPSPPATPVQVLTR